MTSGLMALRPGLAGEHWTNADAGRGLRPVDEATDQLAGRKYGRVTEIDRFTDRRDP